MTGSYCISLTIVLCGQLPRDEQEGDINDQLNTENPLPPGVDLKTLGVPPKLAFIFSVLFQPPSNESPD